jgi:hypothetical protein
VEIVTSKIKVLKTGNDLPFNLSFLNEMILTT